MKKSLVLLGAFLAMLLVGSAVAVAQTEPDTHLGVITSISGTQVLVEEDPQDPIFGGMGSEKGYFTVIGETGISLLVGGDALAPAVFEDLQVGQLVEITYAGPVLESYPSQGDAGSIVILAGPGEEPLCNIAEGCDFDGDGVAEVPSGGYAPTAGAVQYDNAS
ncbi:MAG: hypothetical protein AVDCRST_MAG28-1402 [uncultured Rubrobacteraceae bacterium]|uniref:DUF5666 domain-containing protein n=1 Tax=uncultured Rubrobacteraceae bacterium TaxID=349277 RepID=A0A6J4QPI9_9ACTN|nr:MAG: hypothetical protein AVDCRST_MAG28-1402 [uncultured Rubrobacteraceae bacterium]